MANRLEGSVSPYLRSHADNPVDWQPWGDDAFSEAARRDVPVMVSIGYSTCHWCHVMARESFSDPATAARLNADFVSIKVDREEHPDVDAAYLASASAFTGNLGWPLTVFVTPAGRAFFAGTYFPPTPVQNVPSFGQVLDAVNDAWRNRRDEVEKNAADIAAALSAAAHPDGVAGVDDTGVAPAALSRNDVGHAVDLLAGYEDREFGGFGSAPKFPVAPVQLLLVEAARGGDATAAGVAARSLAAMASSPLRDPVEGGFFRYSVRRDWSDPHYERMLYDNALLTRAYSRLSLLQGAGAQDPTPVAVVTGIVEFVTTTLRTPTGAFGSAQDSESDLGEGGYYALDAGARTGATAPAVDDKVLAGWNGLAIGALAEAGARHGRTGWVESARAAADEILQRHLSRTPDGSVRLIRASSTRGESAAVATLEDYGMLAEGLLRLALASGEVRYAETARLLIDACTGEANVRLVAPGGGDPVLARLGVAADADPSEGAYPSGRSAGATAALLLSQLGAGGDSGRRYRAVAEAAVASVASAARDNPIAFGTTLRLALELSAPATQLVVVAPDVDGLDAIADDDLVRRAREEYGPGLVSIAVSESQSAAWAASGFELFEGRTAMARNGVPVPTAYVCRDFVCRLPVADSRGLDGALAEAGATSSSG